MGLRILNPKTPSPEDFGFGYVVETFYDEPSSQAFLLAGRGQFPCCSSSGLRVFGLRI